MNWRKANRRIAVALVVVLQAVFLFMIFKEHTQSGILCTAVVLLAVLLVAAHTRIPLHHDDHFYEHILVAIWIPAGALVTYYINHHLQLGAVIAAGLVGTIASFAPVINNRSAYLRQLPAAIYCGAFIGMSSTRVADGFSFVLAASLFAAAGLVCTKSLFVGMGGKLGLIAFAGVVFTSLLGFLLSVYGR